VLRGLFRCGASFDMNATIKTAIAISILVAGAVVIHQIVRQEPWWYGSGLAMAWGATVSWARNLV
jgi:hypothetical protein